MIAYISGAISTDPHYRKKFANAETILRACGYDVLNPTMIPPLLTYDQHMRIDLILVEACDVIVLLPDWRYSDGANVELDRAKQLGKEIILYSSIDISELAVI